ncbi:MAG: protein kinase, partial [Chloroflexota bacterium]
GFTCDSLAFDTWLRGERERLHSLALEAMSRLAARHLRNGRVEDAEAVARQQLALEPWSEAAHRQLIEALALAGNRTAALAQFEQCQEILATELGVSPATETFALIERIDKDDIQPIDPTLIAGRYALGKEIGRGAMGIVYRGRDRQTGKLVAIKVLSEERVRQRPDLVTRFIREGEALQQLNHPNIVKLLATDERDGSSDKLRIGSYFLIMEYMAGSDLNRLLTTEKQLSVKQALTIALDLADALTRAHRLNILHRDIKPANVLLDSEGVPHLTDFGIARLGQASQLTEQGVVLGTLGYLSPEACKGEVLDERSDIWSFGVLLYEMLAGERPFIANNTAGIITQILTNPLPDIRQQRPHIPDIVEDLLYRMLAKNRADRIPSIRLVGAELEAILRDDVVAAATKPPAKMGEPRAAFVTPTPERRLRARHNLPAQTTPFVGRELELTELARLLDASDTQVANTRLANTRLVTVVGPGGMGKTRLALEAARQFVAESTTTVAVFPNGVFFVELVSLHSMEQMITAVASAFGFAIEQGSEPLEQIINFMSNKRLLLLLDNFEQLLAPDVNGAAMITAVLQAAPDVKIIVTSRQKLNLRSEVVFALDGLAFPDFQTTVDALSYSAVQLFIQSARRVRYDFALTKGSLAHIARICRLTEGMPLGIVLAAAWVDMLSLAEIGDEMARDIDFLASEMGDLPPRQRSMRAVFDYSWGLLSAKEQNVLAKLSVFQGGFTREAAHAVTGSSLRQLLGLVNKSLVQRNVANGRFSLHELLRQLSSEKLDILEIREMTQSAHAQYYLQALSVYETKFKSFEQKNAINMVAIELENILAGWRWAAEQNDVSLIIGAMSAMHVTINLREKIKAYRFALAKLSPNSNTDYLRDCLLNRLYISDVTSQEITQTEIDRLLTVFRTMGDKKEEEITLGIISSRLFYAGQFGEAVRVAQTRLDMIRQLNDPFGLASHLLNVGFDLIFAGKYEIAQAHIYEGLKQSRALGNKLGIEQAAILLAGFNIMIIGDYKKAGAYLDEALEIRRDLGISALFSANAIWVLYPILVGRFEEAEKRGQIVMKEALHWNVNLDRAHFCRGFLLMIRKKYDAAGNCLGDLVEWTKNLSILQLARFGLAHVAYSQNKPIQAVEEILNSLRTIPMKPLIPAAFIWFIPLIAAIWADNAQTKRAVEIMAMASVHSACPVDWWQNWVFVQNLEVRLQTALSNEDYSAARRQGQEMDVEITAVSLLEELKGMAA